MSSIRVGTAPSPSSSRGSARKTTPSSSSTKNHPPVSDMVNQALIGIKARGGSSMTAIKKYIADTYKVDGDKMKPYIKRYVKTALETGRLVQTKGQGAAGSFRLGTKTMHQMTTSKSKISKPKVTKLKTKRSSPKKSKKPTTKGRPKKKVQKSSGKRSSLSKVSRSSAAKKRKSTKSKKAVAKKTSTPKKGRR